MEIGIRVERLFVILERASLQYTLFTAAAPFQKILKVSPEDSKMWIVYAIGYC